jgi:RNA polymerase sigma-70 factor (ECF subfamily)
MNAMAGLADIVREARPDVAVTESFGPALDARIASAQAAWRDVKVDPERFVRHLSLRLEPPLATLDRLHVEDLYLACGCLDGVPAALEAFDRAHGTGIDLVISAAGLDPSSGMRDRVRERLIIKIGDAPPKIATYAGKGSLGSWVRIFALREAQRLVAQDPPR